MNLLQRLLRWLNVGHDVYGDGYVITATRCARGRTRHRFLGAQFCERGCGAENPRWKPIDLLAEAREVAAAAEDNAS